MHAFNTVLCFSKTQCCNAALLNIYICFLKSTKVLKFTFHKNLVGTQSRPVALSLDPFYLFYITININEKYNDIRSDIARSVARTPRNWKEFFRKSRYVYIYTMIGKSLRIIISITFLKSVQKYLAL